MHFGGEIAALKIKKTTFLSSEGCKSSNQTAGVKH